MDKIPSAIRWKRSDYMRLSGAVRQFNRKVLELEKLNKDYAPKQLEYQSLKDDILSRRELNRVVKSLKRFSTRESQQREVSLPSGENLTAWEYQELKKAQKRGIETIDRYSRMIIEDSTVFNAKRKLTQLKRSKESIEDLFNRSEREFERTGRRAMKWGKTDYDLWRADVFRKNFMYSLSHMKNYNNYDIIYNKLESINNPIQFYNYLQGHESILSIFDYYPDEASASTFGAFDNNQEAFDDGLIDLGLLNV